MNNLRQPLVCDWNFVRLIYEVEIQDENNIQSHALSLQIVLLISMNKLIKYGSCTCNFIVGSLDISCRMFLVRDQCSANFLACLFLPSLQKKSEYWMWGIPGPTEVWIQCWIVGLLFQWSLLLFFILTCHWERQWNLTHCCSNQEYRFQSSP